MWTSCNIKFYSEYPLKVGRKSDSLGAGRPRRRISVGEIFCTLTDRLLGPPSLLYNGYLVSFPGVKRPGLGVDHIPPSSAQFKDSLGLDFDSPSGLSWPVLGWILPLPFILVEEIYYHNPPKTKISALGRTNVAGITVVVLSEG
jgi:hypothetical protein